MSRFMCAVRPYGTSEEWVLQELEGTNDSDRAMEIHSYLKRIGVRYYTVTHYSERSVVDIAIEDIYLN
jgi:hypothetical protein